jgi:hypothetical protein
MGDETIRFASRFIRAADLLARVAEDRAFAAARRELGAGLEAAVGDALDAVSALHETGTEAVKDWGTRSVQVLARVAALRAALARGGLDAAARREAGALVALVGGSGSPAREGSRAGVGAAAQRPHRRKS